MSEVAALVYGRDAHARLREALEGRAELRVVATCEELYQAVNTGRVSAVIAEPRDRSGAATAPTIRRLRRGYPTVPVLAYCVAAQSNAADLLAVAQAGVTGLILRGVDDARAMLHSALESADDACLARQAYERLAPFTRGGARAIVEYCLSHARYAPTVESVSRALGMHRKTMRIRLESSGLPSTQELIGWCRLLLVGRLLEDTDRPLEQIAIQLNYPSPAALRNTLVRYVRLRPTELRGTNAFLRVLDAFVAAIQAGRCVDEPSLTTAGS